MFKQSTVDALCNCLEQANERNNKMFVCGFRTGHILSIMSVPPPNCNWFYKFRCLGCGMEYTQSDNFTPYEQKLIDNLTERNEK